MNPIAISVKDRKIEQYLILHLWKFPESERKLFDKDYNLSIYSHEKGLESFLSIANATLEGFALNQRKRFAPSHR